MRYSYIITQLRATFIAFILASVFSSCLDIGSEPRYPMETTTEFSYGEYHGVIKANESSKTKVREYLKVDAKGITLQEFPFRVLLEYIMDAKEVDEILKELPSQSYTIPYKAENIRNDIVFTLTPPDVELKYKDKEGEQTLKFEWEKEKIGAVYYNVLNSFTMKLVCTKWYKNGKVQTLSNPMTLLFPRTVKTYGPNIKSSPKDKGQPN